MTEVTKRNPDQSRIHENLLWFGGNQKQLNEVKYSETKEDTGIEQQLYEIVRGKNFALNCLS